MNEQRFPKITRFITESLTPFQRLVLRVAVMSLLSLVLLFGIVRQAQLFMENKTILAAQSQERQKVVNELSLWENIARQYRGYRDVYLQIATLQYRLGDKKGAGESLGKVLQLDPNFQEALVLQEKVTQ